jgi:hypothetical protein
MKITVHSAPKVAAHNVVVDCAMNVGQAVWFVTRYVAESAQIILVVVEHV